MHNGFVVSPSELHLFADYPLQLCVFIVEHWYRDVLRILDSSSPLQASRRAVSARVAEGRFVRWMAQLGGVALMSSIGIRSLIEFEVPERTLLTANKPIGPRRAQAKPAKKLTRLPFDLSDKSFREFNTLLTETQRDLISPIESRLKRMGTSRRIVMNRHTRKQLSRLAELLDHLGVHVACLKEIVEENEIQRLSTSSKVTRLRKSRTSRRTNEASTHPIRNSRSGLRL